MVHPMLVVLVVLVAFLIIGGIGVIFVSMTGSQSQDYGVHFPKSDEEE